MRPYNSLYCGELIWVYTHEFGNSKEPIGLNPALSSYERELASRLRREPDALTKFTLDLVSVIEAPFLPPIIALCSVVESVALIIFNSFLGHWNHAKYSVEALVVSLIYLGISPIIAIKRLFQEIYWCTVGTSHFQATKIAIENDLIAFYSHLPPVYTHHHTYVYLRHWGLLETIQHRFL